MPSLEQQQVDALALLAETALHHGIDPGAPGERYQVVVHVDASVLADADDPGQSVLEDGVRVSAETSQRLACDAARVAMRQDADGNLLEVGARTRTIPPALRRALQHRDKGCRFPGCRARFGQGHHIRHWAHGGPTTLSNLALLCRRHHRAVHEEGYQLERRPDGELTFRHPRGWAIPHIPPPTAMPEDPVATLRAWNEADGLELDAHTATPGWRGERLDVAYAIDVLHPGDERLTPKDGEAPAGKRVETHADPADRARGHVLHRRDHAAGLGAHNPWEASQSKAHSTRRCARAPLCRGNVAPGRRTGMADMTVSEWMTPAPLTVAPSVPIPRVQELMANRRIRHLPVVEDGRLVGIVTDRDVRTIQPSPATSREAREMRYLFERVTARAVMTRPVITVEPREPLAEAVRLMLENRVGGLPVMEGDRLVGILTAVDLLRAFSSTLGVRAGRPPRPADAPLPDGAPGHVILVPLDGASGSEAVLDTIREIAHAEGASVRLLSVYPPVHEVQVDGRIVAYSDQETERVEAEARAYLHLVAARLGAVPVSFAVRFGEPVSQIVEEAEAARATLVAMASHRRTGIARIVKGSVAERVERTTTIPVILVQYGSQ